MNLTQQMKMHVKFFCHQFTKLRAVVSQFGKSCFPESFLSLFSCLSHLYCDFFSVTGSSRELLGTQTGLRTRPSAAHFLSAPMWTDRAGSHIAAIGSPSVVSSPHATRHPNKKTR